MTCHRWDEAEDDPLRFSLAALFVVITAVAALVAAAGLKAFFFFPLLVAAGFLIALGRLIESGGWNGAGIHLMRFVITGVAPWVSGIAMTVFLWLVVFSICGYDDGLTNSLVPRAALPWLAPVAIAALSWFFSSRRWAYRGCWACSSVVLLVAFPRWMLDSIASTTAAPSSRDLREAGFAYLFAGALFVAGLLGERHRSKRASRQTRDDPRDLQERVAAG